MGVKFQLRSYVSCKELDELGEGLVKDFLEKTNQEKALFVDMESFISSYLGFPIVYESFCEMDTSKLGFLSDGKTPLRIVRNGKPKSVVFAKDTIVIDKYLLLKSEFGKRRFTLAHEAAHKLLEKHNPMQAAAFRREFNSNDTYDAKTLTEMFSMNELQADRLAAAILMPEFIVRRVVERYSKGKEIKIYGGTVIAPHDKIKLRKIADCLGVSFSALLIRLKNFQLIEQHDLQEYIHSLKGGAECV